MTLSFTSLFPRPCAGVPNDAGSYVGVSSFGCGSSWSDPSSSSPGHLLINVDLNAPELTTAIAPFKARGRPTALVATGPRRAIVTHSLLASIYRSIWVKSRRQTIYKIIESENYLGRDSLVWAFRGDAVAVQKVIIWGRLSPSVSVNKCLRWEGFVVTFGYTIQDRLRLCLIFLIHWPLVRGRA